MPFDQGPVGFRICTLSGEMPEDVIDRFAAKAARPLEYVADEPQIGWVSPRHLLDTVITEETAIYGGYLHMCLRIAERKIPASLLKAECGLAELAALNESGATILPRKEKKRIKEETAERMIVKMPPTLNGIYFTYDHNDKKLYTTATSQKQFELFADEFRKVTDLEVTPLTPEIAAMDIFDTSHDLIPDINFSPNPDMQMEGSTLGQKFLTWLWFYQEQCEGKLPATQLGEFGILIEGPLTFVANGPGALESSIRKGMPTLSAEAKAALTVGKKLKQAKLNIARDRGETWMVTLDADEFVFKGMKLPEGEALDPHSIFEERMTNLYIFQKVFFALFGRFVKEMTSGEKIYELETQIQEWVNSLEGR